MNDNTIKNKIKHYFAKNQKANFSAVDVIVENGNVILKGEVSTQKQKFLAETIVSKMWEVKGVTSKLNVIAEAITIPLPPLSAIFRNQQNS